VTTAPAPEAISQPASISTSNGLPESLLAAGFREVVVCDFEFNGWDRHDLGSEVPSPDGNPPLPICMVARELASGREHRLWYADGWPSEPPFPIGPDTLFVAFNSAAEMGCFLALNWPIPERQLDLYVEFKMLLNETRPKGTKSPPANLLAAMEFFGLDTVGAIAKHDMQMLALRGGPYSAAESGALLDYCTGDVNATERLLCAMLPYLRIDTAEPLMRARYMTTVARMYRTGLPIDALYARFARYWSSIKPRLIAEVEEKHHYGVFEGEVLKRDLFCAMLEREGIPWRLHQSGWPDHDKEVWKEMCALYPQLEPLRQLRKMIKQMSSTGFMIGRDGHNRPSLFPFGQATGRNNPSNKEFVFGAAKAMRSFIKPPPGWAVVVIDWKQQEYAIAAALSCDKAMQEAYRSGDVYLDFAHKAGLVKPGRGFDGNVKLRQICKSVSLGVMYGMTDRGIANRLAIPLIEARRLLDTSKRSYPAFWSWLISARDQAMLAGEVSTVFGWTMRIGSNANPRSILNFPMQSHGAEMMRLACCLATERGIEICCPIHDALVVTAPLDRIDDHVARTRAAMAEASRIVLNGFELQTEIDEGAFVRSPDRYVDKDADVREMWNRIVRLTAEEEARAKEAK
jgi:DNA polymerase family A